MFIKGSQKYGFMVQKRSWYYKNCSTMFSIACIGYKVVQVEVVTHSPHPFIQPVVCYESLKMSFEICKSILSVSRV